MREIKTEKLTVEFRQGVTPTAPIMPRRYTLTHSDITAQLFLTIGSNYAYDKINAMRDEVLGEWVNLNNCYYYYVYLYIDGQFIDPSKAPIRNEVFIRELPKALKAIRYGDDKFFRAYPELNQVSIFVFFRSSTPWFNRIENWGTFSDYEIADSKRYYGYK
ncbi:staygreen family protein [Alloiococcus sp. CFN-8]|uniref:staygreen family protein n=1 Tax=Alloiococcus sp. CFN-8 TaxID=3416081 RepID=UPI003CF218C6